MAERLVGRPAPDFAMETVSGDGRTSVPLSCPIIVANGLYSSFILWTSHLCAQLKLQL